MTGYYDTDIYCQRLNSEGVRQFPESGIAVVTEQGIQAALTMVGDNNGGATIGWTDSRTFSMDIFAQHLDQNGVMASPIWHQGGNPVCIVPFYQSAPQAIPDGSGGMVIAWLDSRATGEEYDWVQDLYAQRINDFSQVQISVELQPAPLDFRIGDPYPNPFNPATTISFDLPEAAKARLNIYDITGRLVAELVNGWRDAGRHELRFDGSNLASGIYIYRLTAGDFNAMGKMVLMK